MDQCLGKKNNYTALPTPQKIVTVPPPSWSGESTEVVNTQYAADLGQASNVSAMPAVDGQYVKTVKSKQLMKREALPSMSLNNFPFGQDLNCEGHDE